MARDYSRDILQQLTEALEKIDQLTERVQRIEQETANKYLAIIYELERQIAAKDAEIAENRARIAALEAEIERLRRIINQDSHNSSAPPSRDQKPNEKPKRPNTYNGRERSGKAPGGQEGHPGKCLDKQQAEQLIESGAAIHTVVEHKPEDSTERYVSKYVIDIKIETIVTEHRFYADSNDKIILPPEFYPDVRYGSNIKAYTLLLWGQGIVSSNRIISIVKETSEVNLSEGAFYNFLNEFDENAEPVTNNIKEHVLSSPIMGIDETNVRCEKRNMFFRNYSTEKYVFYTANPTRGKDAIKNDDILPKYVGTLIHDHNTVNYKYGGRNGECNVHVLRYLTSAFENAHNRWADDMAVLLLMIKNTREIAMLFGLTEFDPEQLQRYSDMYDAIIVRGFAEAKLTKSKLYRDEEMRLLRRLKKYKANHLLFAYDFTVPFDNNMSERDLRMLKTKTKVSGCFRSLEGARRYAKLQTIIKTATKQGCKVFDSIKAVFCVPVVV